MSIKFRLTLMSFLQFFVWGAWLITIGTYCFNAKGWTGAEFGAIFSTLGLSSLFMPAITGIIADKWLNAEKLYGILHILYGCVLFYVPSVNDPNTLYYVIFGAMICYMPTISLSNSIAYNILKNNKYDVIKDFPPIRVWGTIGFIVAMWITNIFSSENPPQFIKEVGLGVGNFIADLFGTTLSANQFYFASFFAIILGVYSFTLPKCPPQKLISENASFAEQLGLTAFKLFSNSKMALFLLFSLFLGAALQLTNMYGDAFLDDFGKIAEYKNSFVVEGKTFIMSISQISETLFILAIPFFLKRYGIKQVMLFSMIAWVLRFALFSYGNPAEGLWMIILSCIVYGMAFDFFNISGSLFVETTTDSKIRSSAQGLFMMMTNGVGAYLGSKVSGYVIDAYYTNNGVKDWHGIWLSFAIYALIIAILFAIFFKHKHNPDEVANVSH
ncbi:nucleoside permease [Flavobacterium sp.]|uniref:nucleoside permease n=1 Tax=Flavobacterium sp. TaxID=239 RepID=UPI0037C14A7D